MNSSMCRADATTHLKIVATALLAASIVVWIGMAARISSTPTAASVSAPARPSPVPAQPSPAPVEHSKIAMVQRHPL